MPRYERAVQRKNLTPRPPNSHHLPQFIQQAIDVQSRAAQVLHMSSQGEEDVALCAKWLDELRSFVEEKGTLPALQAVPQSSDVESSFLLEGHADLPLSIPPFQEMLLLPLCF